VAFPVNKAQLTMMHGSGWLADQCARRSRAGEPERGAQQAGRHRRLASYLHHLSAGRSLARTPPPLLLASLLAALLLLSLVVVAWQTCCCARPPRLGGALGGCSARGRPAAAPAGALGLRSSSLRGASPFFFQSSSAVQISAFSLRPPSLLPASLASQPGLRASCGRAGYLAASLMTTIYNVCRSLDD
jgi:hypothetical protein